jgi:hypothetical protein
MSRARPSARRVVAFAAVWLTISAAAILSPGCYGRNCEGGLQVYGADAGQGRMLSSDMWESAPADGQWLWFPRQQYYVFDIAALNGRTPQLVVPYLSAQPEPNKGGNFTIGGGNLALLSNAQPNRVDVRNDTCSDYYLRLVVFASPLPPPPEPAADGGPAPPVGDAAPDVDVPGDGGVDADLADADPE